MIGKIETVDSIVWTVTDPSSITEDYTNAATAVGRPVVAPVAAAVPAAPAQAAAVGAAVVAPAAAVAAVAPAQAAAAAPVAPAIVAAAPAADEPFLADDYSLADVWMLYQHNDMQAVADAINEHGSHRKHVTAVELKTFWGLILAGSVSPVRGKKNWSGLSARDKEMQRRRWLDAVGLLPTDQIARVVGQLWHSGGHRAGSMGKVYPCYSTLESGPQTSSRASSGGEVHRRAGIAARRLLLLLLAR